MAQKTTQICHTPPRSSFDSMFFRGIFTNLYHVFIIFSVFMRLCISIFSIAQDFLIEKSTDFHNKDRGGQVELEEEDV